jgi:hypothetical protein
MATLKKGTSDDDDSVRPGRSCGRSNKNMIGMTIMTFLLSPRYHKHAPQGHGHIEEDDPDRPGITADQARIW